MIEEPLANSFSDIFRITRMLKTGQREDCNFGMTIEVCVETVGVTGNKPIYPRDKEVVVQGFIGNK